MSDTVGLLAASVGLGLAIAAPLGPTSAAAIRHGLASGALVSFWIGLGAALTDLIYVLATYAGLTPLLTRLPWLPPVLYLFGTLMLGRMGWQAVRGGLRGDSAGLRGQGGHGAPGGGAPPVTGRRAAIMLGVSITVVNPATITYWLSVGGAFITANLLDLPLVPALGAMAAIFAGSATWFAILALLVGVARASLDRMPWLFRAVGVGSGLVLLGFAATFAYRGALAAGALWG